MADKEKSAELILKLYDLRREETMRKARDWYFTFNPDSVEDIMATARGPQSAYYRMVVSYWEMACSFVNHGAIDAAMFADANQEQTFVFAKVQPFIEEMRSMGQANYLKHLEQVVMSSPDAEARLVQMREMARKMVAARAEAEAGQTHTDAANA
ncbi:MAG: hypothetical protein WCD76_15140 [Pyrinomonadaceae bacterium]